MSASTKINRPVFEIGDVVTPIHGSRFGGPAKGMTGVVVYISKILGLEEIDGHRYVVDVKWDVDGSKHAYRSREELGIFDHSCWSFYDDELDIIEPSSVNWSVGEISELF